MFLNEIGDIPLSTQKKLLDVIEYRKYRQVGADAESLADIRVLGATNKDLDALRKEGAFRDDFYFRLSGFRIELPPLRRRPDDIPALVSRFLKEFSKRECKTVREVAPDAMGLLLDHPWPGNIRELRFVIWRAVLRTGSDRIERDQLLHALGREQGDSKDSGPLVPLKEVERNYVLKVLTHTRWNKTRTSAILGISRPALDRKIRAYDLKRD